MSPFIDFFSHSFFTIVGGVLSLAAVLGLIAALYLSVTGVIPVLYRLGTSLSSRKIAIFADDKFTELESILVDSGLVKKRNIIKIDKASIKKADNISFFIVHYLPYKDSIDELISLKKDTDAMIVYAPQDEGYIEKEIVTKINSQRNIVMANFRGRLLNDVLVSMMTTSFKRKSKSA